MKTKSQRFAGVTLVEILLVLVIISSIIYLAMGYLQQRTLQMRTDRASLQMQQILNAGLAYYVANGRWPASRSCLQQSGGAGCTQRYLPDNLVSPWGQPYTVTNSNAMFYVYTPITTGSGATASAEATVVAGKLPLSYVTSSVAANPPAQVACGGPTCYAVGSVNIPGQNLNNASAVNFSGLYHHGACVPVPDCPTDANGNTMQAQVYLIPVSVSGVNVDNNNAYPITSFTAYALGGVSNSPPDCSGPPVPFSPCGNVSTPSTRYWRACLEIITIQGNVAVTRLDAWGNAVTLGAFTRCGISNEPSGSGFNVYSR